MKKLYIIAGPNGAGKTTASYYILPEIFDCSEFVNADEIARGISPFNPDSVAIQAGRIMLRRIHELVRMARLLPLKQHYHQILILILLKKRRIMSTR